MKKVIEDWIIHQTVKTLPVPRLPISEYVTIFNKLGYNIELHGEEVNGWQVDFWYRFTKMGCKTIMLTGSLWYGETHNLELEDE